MTWPSPVYRRPQGIPEHLHYFGEQLRELAVEVRSSVAGLTGEAIGRAVRDALIRFWHRTPTVPITSHREPMARGPYDWSDPVPEGWERGQPRWDEPSAAPSTPLIAPPSARNTALALQAAGWMLQTQGSWLGAIGLGLAIGGLAFVRGRTLAAGVGVVDAAIDLTTFVGLIASSAKLLRTR